MESYYTTNANGYNFPVYYQYAPGPGQYPGYGSLPPPPPPPQPAKPTAAPANPTAAPADPEPAPVDSGQLMRKRGRPKGSGVTKTKTPSSPRRKRAKTIVAPQEDKENQPTDVTAIDVALDSETESSSKRWPVVDRDKFFRFVLAHDAEGDKRFEQHKKNPTHVYEVASKKLFKGKRTVDSIRGQWQRSIKTYEWMVAFDTFTGNGGGDPDCDDDPTAVLKGKLAAARAAGLVIGGLKPATIIEWDNNGWRDLFEERLGNSAKVTRPVVRNSAAALSDTEDFADDSDNNVDPVLKAESKPAAKTPAAVVSEPKHTPASSFRAQATQSFGNIGEYLKVKMETDEKRAKVVEAKLELDQRRFELDRQKTKVEMAQSVVKMEGVSPEVKEAANSFLLDFFKQ